MSKKHRQILDFTEVLESLVSVPIYQNFIECGVSFDLAIPDLKVGFVFGEVLRPPYPDKWGVVLCNETFLSAPDLKEWIDQFLSEDPSSRIHGNAVCPECKGKKKVVLFRSIEDCKRCNGLGIV
jgi:hypothetical protein